MAIESRETFIAVQRNGDGNLTRFKTSSGRILNYEDALSEVNAGAIAGVNMTTMRVEKERMCDAAATLLLSLTEPSREAVRWSVASTLVVRSSVQRKGE